MTMTTGRPRVEALVDLDALAPQRRRCSPASPGAPAPPRWPWSRPTATATARVDVARAALASGATWLGVCSLGEAARAARRRHRRPGALLAAPARRGLRARASPPTSTCRRLLARELDGVVAGARRAGRPARVHLKIDTGLSRNGCPPDDWPELRRRRRGRRVAGEVEVVAVWSHLALRRRARPPVDRRPGRPLRRGLARGDGAPRRPAPVAAPGELRGHAHPARPALRPRPARHRHLRAEPARAPDHHDLRPVMTFRTRVALTKRIAAGEVRLLRTDMDRSQRHEHSRWSRRGTPTGCPDGSSGRMDGVARPVGADRSSGASAWTRSSSTWAAEPGRGRRAGDEVVLFGAGDAGEPTATEWATLARHHRLRDRHRRRLPAAGHPDLRAPRVSGDAATTASPRAASSAAVAGAVLGGAAAAGAVGAGRARNRILRQRARLSEERGPPLEAGHAPRRTASRPWPRTTACGSRSRRSTRSPRARSPS